MLNIRKFFLLQIVIMVIATSCTDSTNILGITERSDQLTSTESIFYFKTRSVPMGRVMSDNSKGYIGRVVDPETGALVTATYATQFYCHEDYQLPPQELLIENTNETDQRWCDSCEVRLYLEKSYGENNNPLKLEVYLLSDDIQRMFNEDSTYYTDEDLMKLLPDNAQPIATRIVTSRDYMLSEAEQNSSNHQDNIAITLPSSLGQRIMESYYNDPKNFSNSYMFSHKVFPGLLFRIANGEGTMLTSRVGIFNLYYDYKEVNDTTTYRGITRFAATPEIIQSSTFTNTDLTSFINEDQWTYIKTPAGIATEVEIPIEEIFQTHPQDSVSLATLSFNRYNKTQNSYELGTPSNLLILRKTEADDFFKNHRVPNKRTSFVAGFSSTSNCYTFNNIGRLISTIYQEHKQDLKNLDALATKKAEEEGITLDEWLTTHDRLDAIDKDWNKLLLLPVTITTNSSGSITSISQEMSLTSIRLKGGPNTVLPMQVVYTRFE